MRFLYDLDEGIVQKKNHSKIAVRPSKRLLHNAWSEEELAIKCDIQWSCKLYTPKFIIIQVVGSFVRLNRSAPRPDAQM